MEATIAVQVKADASDQYLRRMARLLRENVSGDTACGIPAVDGPLTWEITSGEPPVSSDKRKPGPYLRSVCAKPHTTEWYYRRVDVTSCGMQGVTVKRTLTTIFEYPSPRRRFLRETSSKVSRFSETIWLITVLEQASAGRRIVGERRDAGKGRNAVEIPVLDRFSRARTLQARVTESVNAGGTENPDAISAGAFEISASRYTTAENTEAGCGYTTDSGVASGGWGSWRMGLRQEAKPSIQGKRWPSKALAKDPTSDTNRGTAGEG
ncbi:hypothetical protein GGX14DRAFT_400917 [Mycena pura]|uniref:Uncharacterized protein n=1 Tax=Mycena pura TaxID=153505 RepID=A0AAD6V8E6_9AGAR|nr:hypothetical protein GGX14DRAFT_400917 [Mycena pura]